MKCGLTSKHSPVKFQGAPGGGGEQARFVSVSLMNRENNVLDFLDEPTNHLDVDAKDGETGPSGL